jgi:hypothetical protein
MIVHKELGRKDLRGTLRHFPIICLKELGKRQNLRLVGIEIFSNIPLRLPSHNTSLSLEQHYEGT